MSSSSECAAPSRHDYKWPNIPTTHLFGSHLKEFVFPKEEKNQIDLEAKLEKYIFGSPAFATVKYNGTNLAKCSLSDNILSRNCERPEEEEKFIGTSLEVIKKADLAKFRNLLLQQIECESDFSEVGEVVVFGEFMCNKGLYDYDNENLHGTWQVFGAIIVDQTSDLSVIAKLHAVGFAAKSKGGQAKNQILIYMNEKLSCLIKSSDLTPVPIVGKSTNIAEVIESNKDWMKEGKGEGLVITLGNPSQGFKIIKWKCPHDYKKRENPQDDRRRINFAVDNLCNADCQLNLNQDLQNKLHSIFQHLKEVSEATYDNTDIKTFPTGKKKKMHRKKNS